MIDYTTSTIDLQFSRFIKMKLYFPICFLVLNLSYGQEIKDSSTIHHEEIIYFDSGNYQLVESNYIQLDTLIKKSKDSQTFKFFIDAHTDDVGSEESNMALSNNRKQSILDYLVKSGIEDTLINSKFHGEHELLIDKRDSKSRRLNRRAVVQLFTTEKYIWIKGKIIDEETKEGIDAQIEISSLTHQAKANTNKEGHFKILAPLGKIVSIDIYAKDYFVESNRLKITKKHINKDLTIPLPKATIGRKFIMKELLYQGGKSILLEKSKPVLRQLTKFMIVNKDLCVEIAGHVNVPNKRNVKRDSDDFQLSIARSLVVFEELKNKGTHPKRMLVRGYGNWHMVYPKAVRGIQEQANRRVEIVIADCDSILHKENDKLLFRERYSFLAIDRKFNTETLPQDMELFKEDQKKLIFQQVRWLKNNKQDPSQYTYGELLRAGRQKAVPH